MKCPKCKSELDDGVADCYVCGTDLSESAVEWVVLGSIEDKLSADFVREAMKTYEIPAVIFSRSGFFGEVGLPLNPILGTQGGVFEISVPNDYVEEAISVLEMTAGTKFKPKET